MKTQAAIAHTADGGFDLCEVDLAAPSRGEVRVRMQACGICRSDLSALEGKETVEFPVVLGHEGAGIVEAVGDGVGSVKEGDAVILSWTPACGTCPGCLRGEVQLCEAVNMTTGSRGPLTLNGRALDRFMALGAFCEHVVVPQAMAVPVHTGLDPAHTCLIGCGVTTGFGAAVNTAAVRWGETVAVFGCGGVGLAAIQGARIAGASRILAVDPLEGRRQAALRVGASSAIDAQDAVNRIVRDTHGGVDVAIECVGSPAAMVNAFNVVRSGGRSIVVGLPAYTETVELPAIMLLREKSIKGSIYGSANPRVDFQKIASLGDQGQLQFEPLVDKTRHFSEINEGFAEMREGKLTRVVLTF
ncbi:MAG: alcohol dehydrogenase catalytic domain-containing protein [Pseudomonadales bacterium]|jgi:S-(hydroxymethyl)glutathione dehydrogenase/alcohol dehydrogenase|nr:alcohol dehydrogenase catalytic domain-containing protein [Pseudomonadales bacterium]MDP6469694.1 alcohol dehydrogenase catalytic domain-containing protein [Pseudomonadales bacterium]MDP6828935.1 alcohol dehydrogenase catalytic domain-containing protein [Pseudomonadales bacterium]MDP6972735.1 alcohol dehydrogenase catalytic domain-containing protein [Pseudomonadales bacterium]